MTPLTVNGRAAGPRRALSAAAAMTTLHDPGRRIAMASLAGLTLGGASRATTNEHEPRQHAASRVLVACFSRSGNTRVVAGLLRRAYGADSFEIEPAVAYPEEYLATVEQARIERDRGVQPALKATVQAIASYETVLLGFPIWGETAPPIIRSFLAAHDLAGKQLVPFITHGGYGAGDSQNVIARHAPRARLHPPFLMQGEQERQVMERVNDWLRKAPVPR